MNDRTTEVINSDLKTVHTALVRLMRDLDEAMDGARTATDVNVIRDEMREVAARVNAVGSQLLTQQTQEIAIESAAVMDQIPVIEAAVRHIEDVKAFINASTAFLRVVDKAIGVAKLVV